MVDDSVPNSSAGDEPHDEDNSVGYGKPPKQHQFQPGQSGNPSGRPRGRKATPSLAAMTAQYMTRTYWVAENGERKQVTGAELFVAQTFKRSLTNNGAAKILFYLLELADYEAALMADQEPGLSPEISEKLASMGLGELRELRKIIPTGNYSQPSVPKSQHPARPRRRI